MVSTKNKISLFCKKFMTVQIDCQAICCKILISLAFKKEFSGFYYVFGLKKEAFKFSTLTGKDFVRKQVSFSCCGNF